MGHRPEIFLDLQRSRALMVALLSVGEALIYLCANHSAVETANRVASFVDLDYDGGAARCGFRRKKVGNQLQKS